MTKERNRENRADEQTNLWYRKEVRLNRYFGSAAPHSARDVHGQLPGSCVSGCESKHPIKIHFIFVYDCIDEMLFATYLMVLADFATSKVVQSFFFDTFVAQMIRSGCNVSTGNSWSTGCRRRRGRQVCCSNATGCCRCSCDRTTNTHTGCQRFIFIGRGQMQHGIGSGSYNNNKKSIY